MSFFSKLLHQLIPVNTNDSKPVPGNPARGTLKINNRSSNKIQVNHSPIISKKANAFTTTDRANLVLGYLADNMARHDVYHKYRVTDKMLEPYIRVNEIPADSVWVNILKNYRELLYLDQFLHFYDIYPVSLSAFIDKATNTYYKLPVLSELIKQQQQTQAQNSDVKNNSGVNLGNASARQTRKLQGALLEKYKNLLASKLEECITRFEQSAHNDITDVCELIGHGGYAPESAELLRVPDNMIIGLVTPLNKFSFQETYQELKHLRILNSVKTKPGFLNNPACFLRNDNCFRHTVYYYPGQLIPNMTFSTNTTINTYAHGFYIGNKLTNKRDLVFNKTGDTIYETSLADIFTNKLDVVNGKILYISSCRKCDLDMYDNVVEFIYRYEHLLNYINMSKCTAFDKTKSADETCKYEKSINLKYQYQHYNIDAAQSLFYDSALAYNFKPVDTRMRRYNHGIKQTKYMPANTTLNNNTIKQLKAMSKPEKHVAEIFLNLMKKYMHATSTEQQIAVINNIARLFGQLEHVHSNQELLSEYMSFILTRSHMLTQHRYRLYTSILMELIKVLNESRTDSSISIEYNNYSVNAIIYLLDTFKDIVPENHITYAAGLLLGYKKISNTQTKKILNIILYSQLNQYSIQLDKQIPAALAHIDDETISETKRVIPLILKKYRNLFDKYELDSFIGRISKLINPLNNEPLFSEAEISIM